MEDRMLSDEILLALIKKAGGDVSKVEAEVAAIKDGTTIDSFADVENELAGKADDDAIAPEFDDTVAYNTGNLVYHDGTLYKFDSDHAAGAWDVSEVSPTTVAAEFNQLKNTLTTKGQLDWSQAAEVTLPYTPTRTGQLIVSGESIGGTGTLSISDFTASLILYTAQVANSRTGLGGSIMAVSGHEYRVSTFNAQVNKVVFVPVI